MKHGNAFICRWAMCCALLGNHARAQPVDEDAPVQPTTAVTAPRVISAEVLYPDNVYGNHDVLLELVVQHDGTVREAVALSGPPAFRAAAEAAALHFLFEPATRAGTPVAAKIRMQVTFTEPSPSPPPASPASPQPARAPSTPENPPPLDAIDVTVSGERRGSERRLTRAEIRQLPGAFGDPFRAVEVLPGVTPIVSGFPYFYVRGAPPGNVGTYFDGIPVPALYHLAAGPGVLHPAFVERIDLHAGAYPAQWGRSTGAIVAGEMAPPTYQVRGEASVRLIDSGGMLEVPFANGRGSAMFGGRYSYTGALLSALSSSVTLDYWDYQSRVRYDLDEDDSIEVVSFGSGDQFAEDPDGSGNQETILDIDFHRVDLRWDRTLPSGRWRQAVVLGLDHAVLDDDTVRFSNRLAGWRTELSHELARGVRLRTGANALFEQLEQQLDKSATEVGEVNEDFDENNMPIEDPNREEIDDGLEFNRHRNDITMGMHIDVVLDVTPRVEVTPGVRGDFYIAGRERAFGIDPRIAARYSVTPRLTLTHGLGLVHQPPSFLLPIPGAKPSLRGGLQRSLKHSAGTELKLPYDFFSSVELFHNLFFNTTDLLGVEQLVEASQDNTVIPRARGRGVGMELLLRRPLSKRFGGFLSYTLSRSERDIGLVQGPAASDRTHVVNLAASYDLGRHWLFGSRLLFYTGVPAKVATPEASKAPPRTPPFWRLDWRLEKRWPHRRNAGHWALVAEVLNTTANQEVIVRDCRDSPCVDERAEPITIPSIGVELTF